MLKHQNAFLAPKRSKWLSANYHLEETVGNYWKQKNCNKIPYRYNIIWFPFGSFIIPTFRMIASIKFISSPPDSFSLITLTKSSFYAIILDSKTVLLYYVLWRFVLLYFFSPIFYSFCVNKVFLWSKINLCLSLPTVPHSICLSFLFSLKSLLHFSLLILSPTIFLCIQESLQVLHHPPYIFTQTSLRNTKPMNDQNHIHHWFSLTKTAITAHLNRSSP